MGAGGGGGGGVFAMGMWGDVNNGIYGRTTGERVKGKYLFQHLNTSSLVLHTYIGTVLSNTMIFTIHISTKPPEQSRE